MKKLLFIILLMFASNAFADITSVDNVFTANDPYAADFYSRLNRDIVQMENGINNIDSTQVKNDTLLEADMADEINPRIRTAENACNGLVVDMLPTVSASLTTDVPAGTAYPFGYRIKKNSATSHAYTASKWTWVTLDINGDFTYTEQAIGTAAPSVPANSISIARVSTDATTVSSIQDNRLTDCSQIVMDQIALEPYQPTLHDIMKNGIPVTGALDYKAGSAGWVQGLGIQYIDGDSFKVKSGSVWVADEYRRSSSDLTITEQVHDPVNGVSGICSGATWGANVTYNVYAVADEPLQKDFSITACQNTCSGCTNYRYIGKIYASTDTALTSSDIVQAYSFDTELIKAWGYINERAATIVNDFNVTSITDNGTGDFTVTFERGFPNNYYVCVGSAYDVQGAGECNMSFLNITKTSIDIETEDLNGGAGDCDITQFICVGD